MSSFSSGTQKRTPRVPSPEPLWLQQKELPPLDLPATSDDLLVPHTWCLKTAAIYEIMRRFKYLMRLTPFRLEDFCAALLCDDQSPLLTEIHVMLLKAILREEDSQVTHFGPLDQKDSVNISLYLIDQVTWPEVLRSYVESDTSFDRTVLQVLSTTEYPYTSIENRLIVLQFLTDQFLITTTVRDDLLQEGPIHYDDHCRICHRLGDLLCCETCPAVFHLECVDPPLVDVPTEDWQCNICKAHQLSGVYDCISTQEKQGLLCRQEHLGFDRHGRKYWFISRRIFVETEDGTQTWYYSTVDQFELLLTKMDEQEMELSLYRELSDFKDEIMRQMKITENLTNQHKGNKKSYFDIENAKIKELLQSGESVSDDAEKKTEDEKMEEGHDATLNEENSADDAATAAASEEQSEDTKYIDVDGDSDCATDKHQINKHTTRLKTGSLTQKSYVDDTKRKNSISGKDDNLEKVGIDTDTRLTRQKTNQISSGTLIFRLGMENSFKTYVNQFTTNTVALNKPQRNEERDKKRHLSHKFSLTTASEFKWVGVLNGTQANVITTIRQTLLALEQAISSTFMHSNWSSIRKVWVSAVTSSSKCSDFAKVFVILLTCFKSPIFANVWHEQLGHVKLQRITSNEREEKKKIEKREKRERDDEEERNRLAVNFVKYSLGLKHQVWKQKGEEYRIHGQWGWIWMSFGRKHHKQPVVLDRMEPQKVMIPVRQGEVEKIIAIRPSTLKYFKDIKDKQKAANGVPMDNSPSEFKNVEIFPTVDKFTDIDVSRALTAPGRLLYPKLAKKSKLDELLARRISLRDLEEQNLQTTSTVKEDNEKAACKAATTTKQITTIEKHLTTIIGNKAAVQTKIPNIDMDFVNTLAKRIQATRQQFGQLNRFSKLYKCYTKECNNTNSNVYSLPQASVITCYSSTCLHKARVKRELLVLLRKAHTAGNGSKETVAAIMNIVNKKPSILEQKLTEGKTAQQIDNQKPDDPIKMQKDFKDAITTSYCYDANDVTECVTIVAQLNEEHEEIPFIKKEEIKMEEHQPEHPMDEPHMMDDEHMMEVEVANQSADLKEEPEINLESNIDDVVSEAKRPRLNDSVCEIDVTTTKDTSTASEDDNSKPEDSVIDEDDQALSTRLRKSPRNVKSKTSLHTTTTTTTSRTTTEFDDGSIEEESNSSMKTRSRESITDGKKSRTTLNSQSAMAKSTYVMHPNRRFATNSTKAIKKEDTKKLIKEYGPNGSERIYTTTLSQGKIYLSKSYLVDKVTTTTTTSTVSSTTTTVAKAGIIQPLKYPVISSYLTRKCTRSLMVLPQHELVKLARCGGKYTVPGFHNLAKTNMAVWPYPCPRPQFKNAWLYRTMNLKSLAAIALQLRILWCCLRWDDMSTKPPTSDGKHQVKKKLKLVFIS